jgi:hypothetical protein
MAAGHPVHSISGSPFTGLMYEKLLTALLKTSPCICLLREHEMW